MKREKRKWRFLHTHIRFRPQFFWSEKRIPLRVLGTFPDATATAAAKFQLQLEVCLGAGPDGKKEGDFPHSICPDERAPPPFLLLRRQWQGFSRRSFRVQCTVPGLTLPFRPGQEITGTKQGTCHQMVYTSSSGSFPNPPTTSPSQSSDSCFTHSVQGF